MRDFHAAGWLAGWLGTTVGNVGRPGLVWALTQLLGNVGQYYAAVQDYLFIFVWEGDWMAGAMLRLEIWR